MSYDVNSLESHWMPFTANRDFKKDPRIVVKSDGMYLWDYKGGEVIDGSSGLFCTPLGHGRREIAEAVYQQMLTNDYTPHFQLGHPGSFELAERVCRILPDEFNHVFFTNSGSESVETAIKVILAYQRARGQAQRNRLISRERAYHGVNMGGVSLAGMVRNRETFGLTLPNISLIRHTWQEDQRFSKGQPKTGAELAMDLERIAENLGGGTLAAVFIEPVAGSTGTLVPPVGYLEKVREICTKYGLLLVFDEVITGFGRMGVLNWLWIWNALLKIWVAALWQRCSSNLLPDRPAHWCHRLAIWKKSVKSARSTGYCWYLTRSLPVLAGWAPLLPHRNSTLSPILLPWQRR